VIVLGPDLRSQLPKVIRPKIPVTHQDTGNHGKAKMELAVQNNGRTTQDMHGEFTLFPKLPLELRLKIWVLTFRSGMWISTYRNCGSCTPQNIVRDSSPPRPIFPAGLHANHESRTETLRYCSVLSPPEQRTGPPAPPVCVNPSLDSCYLSLTLASRVTSTSTTQLGYQSSTQMLLED
jgi:hypothetical protein